MNDWNAMHAEMMRRITLARADETASPLAVEREVVIILIDTLKSAETLYRAALEDKRPCHGRRSS